MHPSLALDFEAPAINGAACNPDNAPVLLVAGRPESGWLALFHDAISLPTILNAIAGKMLVCHGGKFDLGYLKRAGIDLRDVELYDTLVAQKVIAGNRQWPLSLELVSQRYGFPGKEHLVSRLLHSGVAPADVPESLLKRYCIRDCALTLDVQQAQASSLTSGLSEIVKTRCELTPLLADIEFNGMRLDPAAVRQEYEKAMEKLMALETSLVELAPGININSPKQVAELLYDKFKIPELKDSKGAPVRTEGGARSTGEDTLRRLHTRDKHAKAFLTAKLEHARVNSLMTKCLSKMHECCEADGVLYATFNQNVTQTGRLSSTGGKYKIQFQNMPGEYKRMFVPSPGNLILEADFSQLEFMTAVDMAHDPVGLADILAKRDVHAYTAQVLTEAGQPTSRPDAKPHTFKPLYGGSSGTDAERAYYQAFRQRYSQIYKMQCGWANTVLKTGELITPWGMRFYWPDTTMTKTGYITNTPSIFNYPVQSFATAEIVPIAITGLWHDLDGMESRIINTVHDSVVMDVVPSELELVKRLIVDNFLHRVYTVLKTRYQYDFTTPLSVKITVGKRWGEGEELSYSSK